jgi:hypothetical protein
MLARTAHDRRETSLRPKPGGGARTSAPTVRAERSGDVVFSMQDLSPRVHLLHGVGVQPAPLFQPENTTAGLVRSLAAVAPVNATL